MTEAINENPNLIPQPLLTNPELREFPTTMDMEQMDNGFARLYVRTEGGVVPGAFYMGKPGDPNYGSPKGKRVEIGDVEVDEAYRGQGIATDLLRTFAREMAERGAKTIASDIVSPIAMRNRARVFGPGKTKLWEYKLNLKGVGEVTLSDEQAAASLERSVARQKMYAARGISLDTVDGQMGWTTTVNLEDPEVVEYLNKPLEPWERTPRIKTDDEQHYPEAWDDELAALQQAAAAEALEPSKATPTLTERFKGIGKGLREKAHAWRRKVTVAVGVGATALALLTSSQAPAELDTTNTPVAIEVINELPIPDRPIIEKDVPPTPAPAPEVVTLGAWNPTTGEGSLVGVAEKKLKDSGQPVSGADVMEYASQIQTVNNIDNPRLVQPGQKLVIPQYHKPDPKG